METYCAAAETSCAAAGLLSRQGIQRKPCSEVCFSGLLAVSLARTFAPLTRSCAKLAWLRLPLPFPSCEKKRKRWNVYFDFRIDFETGHVEVCAICHDCLDFFLVLTIKSYSREKMLHGAESRVAYHVFLFLHVSRALLFFF